MAISHFYWGLKFEILILWDWKFRVIDNKFPATTKKKLQTKGVKVWKLGCQLKFCPGPIALEMFYQMKKIWNIFFFKNLNHRMSIIVE